MKSATSRSESRLMFDGAGSCCHAKDTVRLVPLPQREARIQASLKNHSCHRFVYGTEGHQFSDALEKMAIFYLCHDQKRISKGDSLVEPKSSVSRLKFQISKVSLVASELSNFKYLVTVTRDCLVTVIKKRDSSLLTFSSFARPKAKEPLTTTTNCNKSSMQRLLVEAKV